MKNIGWIGLGNMVNLIAINLLKSSYSVFVFCRNQEEKSRVYSYLSFV
ncbi:NAD(P)-binding domain-containing protein [Myroides odoratus]